MTRLSDDLHVILLRSNGQRALNGVFLDIHVAWVVLHASDSSSLLLHLLALALLASKLLHHGESWSLLGAGILSSAVRHS